MTGRPALLLNGTELLRRPGTVRRVRTTVPLAALDIVDARLSGDVAVAVALTSSLDDVVVEGTLEVAWADSCRRCLRPLGERLRVDVGERYVPPGGPGMVDEDALPIVNGQLDLSPLVRDEVLLAVPDAPLCRADCPGLCPICGADLAAGPCGCDRDVRDERWAVLDQLRGQD